MLTAVRKAIIVARMIMTDGALLLLVTTMATEAEIPEGVMRLPGPKRKKIIEVY